MQFLRPKVFDQNNYLHNIFLARCPSKSTNQHTKKQTGIANMRGTSGKIVVVCEDGQNQRMWGKHRL